MAYRKTVEIVRLDNGPDVSALWRYNPGTRSLPWIWFREEDVPDWVREADRPVKVEIEKTGRKRPEWRIVGPG